MKMLKFKLFTVYCNQVIGKTTFGKLKKLSGGPPQCYTPTWQPNQSARRKTDFATDGTSFHFGMLSYQF